jgi:TatD DNase family protein
VPIDRILVETDSPYLAPMPKRGKTNEPAFTRYVLEFIAEQKNISAIDLAEQTTDNFFNLFTKAQKI